MRKKQEKNVKKNGSRDKKKYTWEKNRGARKLA